MALLDTINWFPFPSPQNITILHQVKMAHYYLSRPNKQTDVQPILDVRD
jgi:hypothetical protein